ncbi:6-bladed beta-propeller [candidate division KSB1 bacterium]
MKYGICIVILVLFLFSGICFGQEGKTYTVEVKDGIRLIHNEKPMWGDEQKIELKLVQVIGELDEKGKNYQFYEPRDVLEDEERNIYIFDSGNSRVQKFNSRGEFLLSFGRKGQGPGEFPTYISGDIDDQGNIYVASASGRRIQIFSNEGKFEEYMSFQRGMTGFRILSDNSFVVWTAAGLKNSTPPLIAIYDFSGKELKTFGKSDDFGNFSANFDGNRIGICVSENNEIYASFMRQNRIEKYTKNGDLIFRTDRKVNFDVSPKKIGQFENDEGETVIVAIPPVVSLGIDIDNDNRLWVITYKKQKEADMEFQDYVYFEIFSEDGYLLQTVAAPQRFDFMRIFKNHMYLIDTRGNMCVYQYKIVEK